MKQVFASRKKMVR